MNKASKILMDKLLKLYTNVELGLNQGDILLVCIALEDGHITRSYIWDKYFTLPGFKQCFFNSEYEFRTHYNLNVVDGYIREHEETEGEPYTELLPKGEQHIWTKFMGQYIDIQQVAGLSPLSSNIQPEKTVGSIVEEYPGIIKVISFDDNEAMISVKFQSPTEVKIFQKFLDSYELFAKKNRNYGNSSLEPVGVFGNLPREAKIESRMEDKLARIRNIRDTKSKAYLDAIRDLRVYLFLYEVALEE